MSKNAIGIAAVLISLVMAVPLSARGPAGGEKGQSLATLTNEEMGHITYIREEEKLARDVYLKLFEIYKTPIFDSISESEQRHMDAVKKLIDKYGLTDPLENNEPGEFSEPFAELYAEFVKEGLDSYCKALKVGIDIEILDIEDIEKALVDVEAQDVRRVLKNLLNGSYNHLNAFTSQYKAAGCQ